MDCYDWRYCPGECEICDVHIDRISGWRFVWLQVRRWFVRLMRWDWNLGRVADLYWSPLRAWTNDVDTVIARSAAEAQRVLVEQCGYSPAEADPDAFYALDDDYELRIVAVHEEGQPATTRPVAQWIADDPRPRFLCSTEW